KELIEDSRSMLAGTYVERLQETAQPEARSSTSEAPDSVPAAADDNDDSDDISFDFGDLPERLSHTSTALPSADSTNGTQSAAEADPAFREPAAPANTAEVLKFLIDRTGYIRRLEEEDTPEAYSRIENLRELVNAAM